MPTTCVTQECWRFLTLVVSTKKPYDVKPSTVTETRCDDNEIIVILLSQLGLSLVYVRPKPHIYSTIKQDANTEGMERRCVIVFTDDYLTLCYFVDLSSFWSPLGAWHQNVTTSELVLCIQPSMRASNKCVYHPTSTENRLLLQVAKK